MKRDEVPSLDPSAIELVALSCAFRVQLFGASPKPLFAPQTFREEPKSPRIVRDSGGDNAYRSPLRPRLRLTRRTGCPALFFALDAFVRATGLLAGALSTRMGVPPRRILPSLPMTTG